MKALLILVLISFLLSCNLKTQQQGAHMSEPKESDRKTYTGHAPQDSINKKAPAIIKEIAVPDGFKRLETKAGSFDRYLQNLALKEDNNEVYLYDGSLKSNQFAHFRVVKMDVGNRDLQQCADAIMRLKAEYHYERKEYDKIHFNFTNGDRVDYTKYAKGYRPRISGNSVSWHKTAEKNYDYPTFRKYLTLIFSYAGTYSLSKELTPVNDLNDMKIGDLFIYGGMPGHAVLIVDMAEDIETGKKIFLLAQSYMPAQEIHVLVNPYFQSIDPWYSVLTGYPIKTPEWTFYEGSLKRFAE